MLCQSSKQHYSAWSFSPNSVWCSSLWDFFLEEEQNVLASTAPIASIACANKGGRLILILLISMCRLILFRNSWGTTGCAKNWRRTGLSSKYQQLAIDTMIYTVIYCDALWYTVIQCGRCWTLLKVVNVFPQVAGLHVGVICNACCLLVRCTIWPENPRKGLTHGLNIRLLI